MRRFLTMAMILSLGACTAGTGTEEEDVFSEDTQPIINGTTDNLHLAVGELVIGTSRCSSTAIGLRWVLTAAHCVSGRAPGEITFVRWGSYVYGPVERYEYVVDQVRVHSSYVAGSSNYDVALLRLTQDVNTTPIPVVYAAPAAGNPLTLVGYGTTSQNGAYDGIRRSATNAIDVLYSFAYDYNGSTGSEGNGCPGDSGGPSLRVVNGVEGVAGVHSAGTNPCGSIGRSSRADKHAGWMVQQAGAGFATVGWRNPQQNLDVNGDGFVTSIDALLVINYLNAGYPSLLPAQRPANSGFLDVNGDGFVTSLDSLLVINYLNGV